MGDHTQRRLIQKSNRLILFSIIFWHFILLNLILAPTFSWASGPTVPTVASQVSYYSINDGTNFSRSLTPTSITAGSGTISQTTNPDGSVQLTISNISGYADDGFYLPFGTLGDFQSLTLQTAPGSDPVSINLWFDSDNNGEFFIWNGNVLSALGNDSYILGPNTVQNALTVDANSTFDWLIPGGGSYTVAQLKNGAAPGITSSTKIAIWVGIATGGGSLNATINSLSIKQAVSVNPVVTPTNLPSQTITGTMDTGATIIVTCPTASVNPVSYPTTTSWQVMLTNMTEGSNTVSVTATDLAGIVSNPVTTTIVLDTTSPVTTATPPGGVYGSGLSVTLASNETATIYFTTDGTTPTTSSTVYTGSLTIAGTTVLNYFAVDMAGNREQPVKTATYILDTTPPVVVSSNILNNSITAPANTSISVGFSEALAQATVTSDSVQLVVDSSSQPVSGSISLSADGKTITFTPSSPLSNGIQYRFTITSAVTDFSGNAFAGPYTLKFTTSLGSKVIQNQSSYTLPTGGYDYISITNSTVTTTGPIAVAGSLAMTSSTLITQASISANSISLTSNSILNHPAATTTTTWKVDLTAATTISIDSTSKIDVTGKGYLGGDMPPTYDLTGRTYPNTANGGSALYAGGSYGGPGGGSGANGVYGDLTNPSEWGSGGGPGDGWGQYVPGGSGGGLVKITAGTLQVNGSIIADGAIGTTYYGAGGGSGGGINIHVSALSGTGTISAKGGAGNGGSGGGGRIAVYYDTMTLSSSKIIASGTLGGDGTATTSGGAGTVYLKGSSQTYGDLIINNNGISASNSASISGGIFSSVTVTGAAIISMTSSLTTGTDMSLNGGKLTISGGLTAPGNITMTGSTLSISGTLSVTGNITLQSQSVLTHAWATTSTASKLDIQAANFTIDSTSKIDVTGRGYLGGSSGGNVGNTTGRTNGNTVTGGSTLYNGGSYGGSGGLYSSGSGNMVNAVYGDLMNPNELGSGGGAGDYYGNKLPGGSGGGLVKITAGSLQLNGSIIADGTAGSSYGAAGGSGGGVNIHVSTLSGSGSISAKGGTGDGGAGGGGRIAVYYDTMTMSSSRLIASGGKSGVGSNASYNGGAGTVYLKSNTLLHGDLIIDNGNTSTSDNSTPMRVIGIGAISALTSTSMTNASATWTSGALKGLQVNPNIDQPSLFTVIDNSATTLYIDPAGGDLTQVAKVGSAYRGVYSFNSIKVMGMSKVRCDDRFASDSDATIDGSSTLVTRGIDADTVMLTGNSLLTHTNATTTTVYSLILNTATTLLIDSTSKIDVTGKGYLGGASGGNGSTGRTNGNTATGGSTSANGGSYGGLGGLYSTGGNNRVNALYGDPINPNEVGSGGGAGDYYGTAQPAGNGGGLVKITAGALQLNGSIVADGSNGNYYGAAGGSGGGVNIRVSTLSGMGTISAKGGTGDGGGGGGGRVALYCTQTSDLPNSHITVVGGTGSIAGGAGSIYYETASAPSVTITSPVAGLTNNKTPLLIYSVDSSGTVTVQVDGAVVSKVSGSNLDPLTDGVHTVRVESMSSIGIMGFAEVTFTVDTASPAVTINPVSSPTNKTMVTISGTRGENATVSLSINTSATAGLVTYPSSTTWSCTVNSLAYGTNAIIATATDAAGNSSTASLTIQSTGIAALESVSISNNNVDVSASGSTTIFFTLTQPAVLQLLIIPEKSGPLGTPVYTATQTCASPGAYLFTWDGKNSSGLTVPDEAYIYLLEAFAEDGSIAGYYNPDPITGAGNVNCSRGATYDPYKNQALEIMFDVNRNQRVNMTVSSETQVATIMNSVPKTSGNYTTFWNGRNGSGYPMPDRGRTSVTCGTASLLPENVIITQGDTPQLSDVKVDPYEIHLSYGQFSKIKYTLSRRALVTIRLKSPSGATQTLLSSSDQPAGTQTFEWSGLDPSYAALNKFITSETGDFIVTVEAANPEHPERTPGIAMAGLKIWN